MKSLLIRIGQLVLAAIQIKDSVFSSMTDLKLILQVYFIGGITFIPLLLVLSISAFIILAPRASKDQAKEKPKVLKQPLQDSKVTKSGWLHLKRDFELDPTLSVDESYASMIIAGYKSLVENKDVQHRPKPKARYIFWAVLKSRTLYIYTDDSCDEIVVALNLDSIDVSIYPPGLLDAELFTKRTAIKLQIDSSHGVSNDYMDKENNKDKDKDSSNSEIDDTLDVTNKSKPYFIHALNLVDFEDWYHEFIQASDPASNPYSEPYPSFIIDDMKRLVSNIDNDPDPIPTRWLNALLGRYFFGIYRTQWIEDWIIGRIMKKLKVVKRPKFLSNITVTEANLGDMPPKFSKPVLKELTKEGDASVEVHVSFKGCVKITLTATASINLGNRLKSYSVDLVLAVVLRSLEGNMIIKMKKPPSNRIWYGFTTMPEMELDVEPVVEDRKVKWNMVLSTIKDKLREMIQEGLVMPAMDDIAFFDTSNEIHRGGIFSEATRREGTKFPQNRPESIKQRDQEILEHSDKKESIAPTSLDGTDLPSGLPGIDLTTYEKDESDANNRDGNVLDSQTSLAPAPASALASSSASVGSTSSKTKSWFSEKFNKDSWLEHLKSHNTNHQNSSLADGSASLVGKHLKKKESGDVSVTHSEAAVSPMKSEEDEETGEKLSVKSDNNAAIPISSSSSSSISVSSKGSTYTNTPSSAIEALKSSPKLNHAKDALKKISKKKKSHGSEGSLKKKAKDQKAKGKDNEVPLMKPAEKLNERMHISRSQPTVELNLSNETNDNEINESRRRSSVTTPPKASPMMSIPGIPSERKGQSSSSRSIDSPSGSLDKVVSESNDRRQGTHRMTSSISSNNSTYENATASMSSSPNSNRSSRSEQLLSRIKSKDKASRSNDDVNKEDY
ncbi:hypothetical protein E3P89_04051 [Wallemia ichthyophaga]|uniref:SMP-LTD domain-containing protein n=1 Tax=Wallemia ichthyophaga TaxID=245174 RepID=A0A4T0KNC1_WALIC|nr:hypothetical protein E3P98_04081 [Wallemia ichthyophaga]TIA94745.1 hypothetical protein E3P95_04094 [Wallemia ichthyophaga]TIA95304.1 hypothetical protein E3P94_04094 [Wallemia ichthyophaga]TIB07049.1 hypothetical protein E3P93_04060 [Wallemia ichthyophaga]TIB07497.1 hypothetical protein E3P90_04057 [Wallemia ichthyophaga]